MSLDADRPARTPRATEWRRLMFALCACLTVAALAPAAGRAAADPCASPENPVACENTKPGAPASQWQVTGGGDSSIQGFATQMSVQPGDTVDFKLQTDATAYHLEIYRLGYYGGDGARLMDGDVRPSASLPQTQPACPIATDGTGLIDCGNWAVSASWEVPGNAVSGVYVANLIRDDTGGASQIIFVVRDDSSR